MPRAREGMARTLVAGRLIGRLIGLVWEAGPHHTVTMLGLRLARALQPLAVLWMAQQILDALLRDRAAHTISSRLVMLVCLELLIILIADALARASALVESLLGDVFTNRLNERIIAHAATLDLAHFEDPRFHDRLERARQGAAGRVSLLTQLVGMAQDLLSLASLTLALAVQEAWLLALLVVAILPSMVGETHYAGLSYSFLARWTPERRRLDYLRQLGTSEQTVKEVRLFGLSSWLMHRYRALADRFYRENYRLVRRRAALGACLTSIGTLGFYGAYAAILQRAVAGALSVGELTFLAGAFQRSRDLIQRLLLSLNSLYEQSLYLSDLFAFLDTVPTIRAMPGGRALPRPIRNSIVFEKVGFRYGDRIEWAIRNFSFSIHPGERLALVGENGAGKTTIIKLLTRLYDPTEGRILIDGVDLRDYAVDDLRRNIGVIFQDFVRYDMACGTNIGVGHLEAVATYLEGEFLSYGDATPSQHTGRATPFRIAAAAKQALATELVDRLPRGFDQMLGRRFEGGIDLSGGEWQKIALSRAYARDAQLVILDEPTAALDARAEHDIFARFTSLMRGRTAVIISHRFSTVRMADRIVVLQKGGLIEHGTHGELVERKGLYAELFDMQAAGYR